MSDDKKEILFKQDVQVKDHNGEVEFKAKAGSKHKLNPAACDRWVRRDKATFDLKWKPEVVKKDDDKKDSE